MQSNSNPAKLALEMRERYNTDNPFKIAEQLGVITVNITLPESLNGFFTSLGGIPMIFLNELLDEYERRVVCAHELGHALLHKDYNTVFLREETNMNMGKLEREADIFCAFLLLDDRFEGDEQVTVEKIAAYSAVPADIVKLRYGI